MAPIKVTLSKEDRQPVQYDLFDAGRAWIAAAEAWAREQGLLFIKANVGQRFLAGPRPDAGTVYVCEWDGIEGEWRVFPEV
jgi:hypothetical protein